MGVTHIFDVKLALLLIIDTRLDKSIVYLQHVMNPIMAFNSSVDLLPYIVLDINQSNISHNISWLSLMAPSCFPITMESQWPFESAEYGLGGREASPVLISHMQLLWQYSLHLSTIEPSLIQETTSDGTPARGVLWDQQRNPAQEQMWGITHKHKYYAKIKLKSSKDKCLKLLKYMA